MATILYFIAKSSFVYFLPPSTMHWMEKIAQFQCDRKELRPKIVE